MSFFTLTSPCAGNPPKVKGSAILIRDKFGNLIVCEPEPSSLSSSSRLPSISTINTINASIDTSTLQKYTIYEGSDGNKYLSPNVQTFNQPRVQLLEEPQGEVATATADDESDDNEIPPHELDHMYARKPKEPGTETKKPVKRRAKKKEVAETQFIIQEVVQQVPEAPKINIIRQTLPQPSVAPVYKSAPRPRILNSRDGSSWSNEGSSRSSTTDYTNVISQVQATPPKGRRQRKSPTSPRVAIKTDLTMGTNSNAVFDECELPHLGAYVTIISDDDTSSGANPVAQNQHFYSSSYIRQSNSVDLDDMDETYMNPNTSDGTYYMEEEDPLNSSSQVDETLFFQFPIDEVEEIVV